LDTYPLDPSHPAPPTVLSLRAGRPHTHRRALFLSAPKRPAAATSACRHPCGSFALGVHL